MASPGALTKLASAVKAAVGKTNDEILFDPTRKVDFIPTGCTVFDLVTGGGLPRGRITEIFGMEHSGKTALALSAASYVQNVIKGAAVLLDFEHAFDARFSERTYNLRQDGQHFLVISPDNIEEGGAALDALIENGISIDLLICDSVDAMKPKALIESSLDDEQRVGAQAKAIARVVAKLRNYAKHTKCAILFINQMRVSINTSKYEQNVGTGSGYNPMETHTTPGGYALRFYASLRVKLEYGGKLEDEAGSDGVTGEKAKVRYGNQIKIINIKNKVATPFLKGLAHFMFPTSTLRGGWDAAQDMIYILKKRGNLRQSGTKLTYNGLHIAEWSHTHSKRVCEEMFSKNAEVMADAEALLASFMSPASGAADLLETMSDGEMLAAQAEDQHAAERMSLGDLVDKTDADSGTSFAKAPAAGSPFVSAPSAAGATQPFSPFKTPAPQPVANETAL